MAKKVWLSETQLGDLFWAQYLSALPGAARIFREFQIGRGRIDFTTFTEQDMNLYELKVTADVSSVLQIQKYRCDMAEYWRHHFMNFKKCPPIGARSGPNINTYLVARHFDTGIQELCSEMGMSVLRIKVINKDEIEVVDETKDTAWRLPENENALNELKNYYGVPNGSN